MARTYISKLIRQHIREQAEDRCGYCLSPQHLVMGRLQIEHIHPLAKGGGNEESNLWLACSLCNEHKGSKTEAIDPETGKNVRLFNPRTQNWWQHFSWSEDGLRVIGLTPIGRATVVALHLSTDPDALIVRSFWVKAGWHPPTKAPLTSQDD